MVGAHVTTCLTFVAQRLSVAVQLSVAQEAAEALGLSVAPTPGAVSGRAADIMG